MSGLHRPQNAEYAEHYRRYVELVPDGDIVDTLTRQLGDTLALLQEIPEEHETFRYAPDKWTIREVVGHTIDIERLMAFRALAMARSDGADLPGMDPDEWGGHSNAGRRTLDDLSAEWAVLRRSNVHLFATLPPDAGLRVGKASGWDITVRSFPWIVAGHELWHRDGLKRDYIDALP
jgi:DinB superfamily